MNTSVSAYTTLESLLLFQCLRTYGVGTSVFGSISDLLKKNPDITAHRSYQSGRLSPDALRNFYLERLRKEIEHEQTDYDNTNGLVSNPRKRKKASPALPTVQESLQHQHLIPQLVTKLYASYRNEVTEQIRADEERYEKLQRELKSIENGEWDEQLRARASGKASASQSPTLPKKSPQVAQKPLQPAASPQLGPNGVRGGSAGAPQTTAQNGNASSPRKKQASLDQQRSQPLAASPTTRYQQPVNANHNGPPYPNISPFPQSQPLQPSPQPSHARPSHPHSPADTPGQQFQPPPMQPYPNNGIPSYPHPPAMPGQYQQYPPQQQGQSPMPHQQRMHYPPHPQYPPPPQAGFMLPPFQVSPQDPSRVHPQNSSTPQYPPVSTPVSNRQQPPPPRSNVQTPASGKPVMHPLVTQARHSLSTPLSSRSPISVTGTPLSAKTKWKLQSLNSTPAASPRPMVEPIDDFVPIKLPKESPSRPRSTRKTKGRGKGKEKELEEAQEEPQEAETPAANEEASTEIETRSGRSRRKAPAKRTRPGSIASSRAGGSVRDRSRSQSILSHTETVAADNDSQAGNRIKSERGTSVDAIEEEVADTPSMSTRRRGAATTRQKRKAREASLDEPEDQFSTPGPPRTIAAPRYFARTTQPIMNDIQSHKHASTFGTAVRAKDAEGYYDIIKRPTDLKSIAKAIAHGGRQVAAAATDTPVGSPGGGGGMVELPITLDNIPPKSIVNAAQLEKELMRMFVNAVMFNPGEDGVVDDAREMFESVQRSVSTWRNVERGSGRTEVEDTPAAEEEEIQQTTKRRKV